MGYLSVVRPEFVPVTTHEGGLAYEVDDLTRLRRFLILGSETDGFYVGRREVVQANIACLNRLLDTDPVAAIDLIVAISTEGRAPKNEPAILALAIAASHPNSTVRQYALAQLSAVCRTGTHLLHFMAYGKQLRKSSRMYRTAISRWFTEKDVDRLAYQAVKYKQRDGWSLRDALRIARPTAPTETHGAVFRYIVRGEVTENAPPLLMAVQDIHDVQGIAYEVLVPDVIKAHRIPREAVPTEYLNSPVIWDALLADMPMTAMIRNLAKMTSVGLLTPTSAGTATVVARLRDRDRLVKARVHPIALLNALRVYEQGHGDKGSLRWNPVKSILTALDEAFYAAFATVTPSGKRMLLALDVSGSMMGARIAGTALTARTASCAMALVTAATEPQVDIMAYSHTLVPFPIRPSMRLDDVIRQADAMPFGGTDCALPFVWARMTSRTYDAVISYTDSETGPWQSYRHELNQYRAARNRSCRSIVVATTASTISLNDPLDPRGLDVCGFDTTVPQVLSSFTTGEV